MSRIPEVIVVGGGVIGWAVAYELAKRSVPVLLVDKSLPGRATSASAGGLWPVGEAVGLGCGVIYHAARASDDSSSSDEPTQLPAAFRDFLIRSSARFPDLAAELWDVAGLDIEYAPGTGLLFLMYTEQERAFVNRVARSLPPTMHLDVLSPKEATRVEPRLTPDVLGAALLPGEYQVNPMLLAEAFKRGAIRLGATFLPDTRVTGLRLRDHQVAGVEAGGDFFPCGTVANAAGAWAGRLAATAGIKLPVFPVRGQIVLTEALPQTLNGCLSTSACYLAQKAHGEVLIGSTTERVGFDVSVTQKAIQSLCRGALRAVPMLRHVRVKRVWAGLRPGTPDELPVLSGLPGLDGYINATGGFRTGIVAAPLTGEVVAQLLSGESPGCTLEPFSAARFGPVWASETMAQDAAQPRRSSRGVPLPTMPDNNLCPKP